MTGLVVLGTIAILLFIIGCRLLAKVIRDINQWDKP